jgi:hypothetical protein
MSDNIEQVPGTRQFGIATLLAIFAGVGLMGNLPLASSPLIVMVTSREFESARYLGGALATGFMLSSALSAIVTAALAPVLRPRLIAGAGVTAVILGTALAAFADNWTAAAGALSLAGIGAGAATATAARFIAQADNPDGIVAKVGVLTSVLLIIFGLAASIASEQFGSVGLFVSIAITAAVLGPMVLMLPRLGNPLPSTRIDAPARSAALWLLGIGILIYAVKDGMGWAMSQVVAETNGLDQQARTILLGGAGAFGLLGAIVAVSASRSGAWLGPGTVGMIVVSVASTLQFVITDGLAFVVVQWLATGAHLFVVPFILGLAAVLDPSGRVVGAAAALLTLGSAFGPIMGAMTVDAGGLPLLAGLTALLSVVAFGLMVPAARVRQSAGVKR